MRTTLEIPDRLISEAMKASNQRTKTGVIIAALEEFVRRSRLQRLKRYRGRLDCEIDLDVLRKRK
ncbi:MAG: type II toxin-antitoxin system VapB family antitoxin [Candidatus Erginobacter occultus]|nr:type II toxin-antitoxin system VapB family antitoxin [Candidatus Erginobacter occultus]